MTKPGNIRIAFPEPLHTPPHQSGMFEHFPDIGELEKAYAALSQATTDQGRTRCRGEIAGLLKHMAAVYHPSLPELLAVCRSHAALMSDANLEKALSVCEVAFHGHYTKNDRPDFEMLLNVALHALAFSMLLLRHKLERHKDAFDELHGRFFHFAHCVMACQQQLGGVVSKRLMAEVAGEIAAYLLIERMDFFSMSAARQQEMMHTLTPILSACEVYFIPAGEEADRVDGFWVEQVDQRLPGRSLLHRPLASRSASDRIVAAITPLIRLLEEANRKPGGTIRTRKVISPAMSRLIHEKLKLLKRKDSRLAARENVLLLSLWDDVVNLPADKGSPATLVDVDDSGFRLVVDDPEAELPDVDSLIAINRTGQGVKRATLIWKRVQARGVMMGGTWLDGEFDRARLSMLGHSEMSTGIRKWHVLMQQIDEKHVACWIGEPELQPGISALLPIEGKNFSSLLDRVEHRGGNFCQGVLAVGEEWKEVDFELDL
ncbi:MAG: hypothetical protein RQ867_08615 [Mariprofundaceae bacterium]|nr:hypothetical protein [Mariprofundaceae bacterium]